MWALPGMLPATLCVLAPGAAEARWKQPGRAAPDGFGSSSGGKQQHSPPALPP